MKNTLIILLLALSFAANAGNNKADKTKEAKAREWIKNQPLEFIENKGQFMRTDGKAADEVLFKTSFGGCDIYITDKGLSYVFVKMEEVEQDEIKKTDDKREEEFLHKLKFGEKDKDENKSISYYRLDMNLDGASISKSNIIKENESKQGHYNFFYAHCPEGIYDVKGYGKITIKNIYKGIDWVIYTSSDSKEHPLKYDFVVHPEADYKDIKIKFLNAQNTSLSNNDTKLKIETIAGNIEEGNLYSYQNNSNSEISSKYIIDIDSTISFEIEDYDTTKTLVIDPLVWATYYGGSNSDFLISTSVDIKDNLFIVGWLLSTDFPTQQLSGAYWQPTNTSPVLNAFMIKFNCQDERQWATYYGGNHQDAFLSICVDSNDDIYVTGYAMSFNFPTQQLAGAFWQPTNAGNMDVVILKFNNQGIRLWATYYGGSDHMIDAGVSICVDSQDNIYITGYTNCTDFPVLLLTGAYWQPTIGGSGATDDIFILKFNNQGVRLWATYYGGNSLDESYSICTDKSDNIYVTGHSSSSDFPTQQLSGAYWQPNNSNTSNDAFILKFNNLGARIWATYYGGTGTEFGCSVCTDSQDNIFLTGYTNSYDFPVQQLAGAYWQPNNAGNTDTYILKFNNLGVRQWATYYGGNGGEIHTVVSADKLDNIYLTGSTVSTDFPTQQLVGEYWQANNAGNRDNFIIKYTNMGVRQWATYYGTDSVDSRTLGNAIAVNSINSVYIVGNLGEPGMLTKDPGNGAYYANNFIGKYDGFIIKIVDSTYNIPISLQSNRNNICANDNGTITLNNLGSSGNNLKWYSGGCGQNYIGMNSPLTIQSPTQTTTYYARWESNCGSINCDSIKVIVKNCDTIGKEIPIYIPNSFTPSGDGLNEVFKIETIAIFSNFKLLIFNRWGEQIFESCNKNIGWDGTFKGEKVPLGVYVFKFSGTIKDNNEQVERTGRVTLIR